MEKILKNKRIIIFLIIFTILICGYFKGITFSTVEGVFYLEGKQQELYSAQYDSLGEQAHYDFVTKVEAQDKPVIEYMNNKGYELVDRSGALFVFSNGKEDEVISRKSIFNKYYIWEN